MKLIYNCMQIREFIYSSLERTLLVSGCTSSDRNHVLQYSNKPEIKALQRLSRVNLLKLFPATVANKIKKFI